MLRGQERFSKRVRTYFIDRSTIFTSTVLIFEYSCTCTQLKEIERPGLCRLPFALPSIEEGIPSSMQPQYRYPHCLWAQCKNLLRNPQKHKFAAGINDTYGGQFATGINDTGSKFATGVNDLITN
jgi:hypothetical protein